MSEKDIMSIALESLRSRAEVKIREMPGGGERFPTFRSYVNHVNPKYHWAKHHIQVANVLDGVARDEIDRVMFAMPPRHGKTEEVSRLFPGYYFQKHSGRNVGLCSYGADLAYQLSRDARNYYVASGGKLDSSASAVKLWKTSAGGMFWAAGVGGPITGRGMHLGIIDDPFKNEREAASQDHRDHVYNWYKTVFYTRLEVPGALILMYTRWHLDDLQGRLLEEEELAAEPQGWTVLRFEAIKTDTHLIVPETCKVIEDDRKEGEALWPEKYPVSTLRKIRDQLGGPNGSEWLSLYQQSPIVKGGTYFDIKALEVVDSAPEGCRWVRGWDLAGTEGGGDATVGVLMGKHQDGKYYIQDVDRFRFSTGRRDSRVRWNAEQDKMKLGHVAIDIEQEPASAGKAQMAAMVRLLSGFEVFGSPKTTDSETYCAPFRSQVEYGNVKLVRGNWNKEFIAEMETFPKGRHDDQVMAATRAFNRLNEFRSLQMAFINVPAERPPR